VAHAAAAVPPGAPQPLMFGEHRIEWLGADRASASGNEIAVSLKTNRGRIGGRYHPAMGDTSRRNQGVIWFSGAGGGVDGPARGLYAEASHRLQQQGIASLRLDYRKPQDLHGCVLDALCGIAFFAGEGISRVALVGQSFGGAVAICAGASSPRVRTVVAMSSQTTGSVQMAPFLSPRSLLVIQGTRDKVLPVENGRKIYEAAREPKELRYMKDAGHNLLHARAEVLDELMRWIPEQLRRPAR
jgi:fermentation-respiration switch protein FrsA (DUF1100 family)